MKDQPVERADGGRADALTGPCRPARQQQQRWASAPELSWTSRGRASVRALPLGDRGLRVRSSGTANRRAACRDGVGGSRERRVARSGNFDLVTAREAHQGMVCWTSPRTAHEQTENRNASAVQVVVRACSSTKRKRDAGRALRSRRSTSQESAPLVVRAVRADLRVNSFLLSCSRACRSLSLGRRHGVNQSLAPKQVETAGACRGDRQKMAVWNSSARGWRPLRGHHPS